MAHLPPKAPNMTQNNWSEHHFPHQRMENLPINSPSWVDDFLDFSSSNTRRGSHKRSMSDSIAFLDAPAVEQCRKFGHHEFERFDDEQLISMFNDDDVHVGVGPTVSGSNPSSPSDHNSMNDQDEKQLGPSDHLQQLGLNPKSEPDEVESSCKSEGLSDNSHANLDNSGEKIVDPKRIKRILANRQSAQRSRVRKLHYISELERSVNSLQAEVSVLSPRVAFLDHQRLVLNVDNSVLKQRIAALAQDKVFKDAHQEALKREIERLRQIYYQQNLKNMENVESQTKHADTNCFIDKEQLAVN